MNEQIDALVDGWFSHACAHAPLSQNVDAYNQVFSSLPDLKAGIARLLSPTAAAQAETSHTE